MTPVRARFILSAITALFLATAGNALFLQERPRSLQNGLPGTAVPIALFPLEKPASAEPAAPRHAQAQPDPSSPPAMESKEQRLHAALQRELAQRGYAGQLRPPAGGLRRAVLAYEFDNAMPLTGEPTEALLKQILFDPNQAPRGVFADRAEANQRLVMEIQKMLLGLGFFRGSLSGRMDVWTQGAVKDFERHRGMPLTGRLTETTLLALISYSGQTLQLSPGQLSN